MDRRERLAERLRRDGATALVVLGRSARDPDLAPWVGPAHLGGCVVVAPAEGAPRLAYHTAMEREEAAATGLGLVTPGSVDERLEGGAAGAAPGEVLGAILDLCGLAPPGRLLLAGHPPAGEVVEVARALSGSGWEVASGGAAAAAVRRAHPAAEIAAVRRAADGACAALRGVARLLASAVPGGGGVLRLDGDLLTAGRLRREIARDLAGRGLEQPHGNIVAAGADAAVPHNAGADDRILKAGESIVVDVFPRGLLFADCTRTFCVGEPPARLAAGHRAVADRLAEARRGARAGGRGWDLQEAACRRLEEAGWTTGLSTPGTETGYVHGLGHGVGFELHEAPSFRRTAGEEEGRLEAGDVVTLEPGLYDPGEGWGVRLEDLCLVTGEGVEVLTPLPLALDPGGWTST